MNEIILDFLENTVGTLLAILAIAIFATPIILIISKGNFKKYWRILIEFLKKII